VKRIRLAIVGFGTVGRWLADAVHRRRPWLLEECGGEVSLVAVANRRDGFVTSPDGFDVPALLDRARTGSLLGAPGARSASDVLAGLAETELDVLAEASNTDPREKEPALSHLRAALARGVSCVTSSKGACAEAALDLLALAREHGAAFRMESTVMSGTPVLSTIREGLAGARVASLRGILNGTCNEILTSMAAGRTYAESLAEAQARGYAEPDPTDDVDAHDVVAKVRILAAVAFGRALPLDAVARRGIAGVTLDEVRSAAKDGRRIKLLATLGGDPLAARVEPVALPLCDPLARVDGVDNALSIQTDTVREVTVIGPGAGREQAGQGLFADLVAVARRLRS
jgi:homoserine dehydrogenase